jgi:hypothetical protein
MMPSLSPPPQNQNYSGRESSGGMLRPNNNNMNNSNSNMSNKSPYQQQIQQQQQQQKPQMSQPQSQQVQQQLQPKPIQRHTMQPQIGGGGGNDDNLSFDSMSFTNTKVAMNKDQYIQKPQQQLQQHPQIHNQQQQLQQSQQQQQSQMGHSDIGQGELILCVFLHELFTELREKFVGICQEKLIYKIS